MLVSVVLGLCDLFPQTGCSKFEIDEALFAIKNPDTIVIHTVNMINISSWLSDASFLSTFPWATLLISSLFLVIALTYHYVTSKYRYWTIRHVNGPAPVPFIGNNYFFTRDIGWHDLDLQQIKKYGKVYGTYQGMTPVLMVADPQILQDVLVRDFSSFSLRHSYFHKIQKQSLIAVNGKRWKEMRMIMSSTFTSGKMKAMHGLIKQSIDNLLHHMDSQIKKGSSDFNNKELYGDLTLGVISKCAFATDANPHQERGKNIFLQNIEDFFRFPRIKLLLFAALPDWMKNKLNFSTIKSKPLEFLAQLSKAILDQRREAGEGSRHVDLLQLMMDAESKSENGPRDMLTDEEIIANIIIVLIAGYDTTANLLTYATYLLALHPGVQKRLREEIVEAVDADGGEIKYETIMGLKYLDAVVNETLRIYPPVIRVVRQAVEDYEFKSLGFKIQKDTKVMIPIYAVHHDEELHPDSFKFNPERFMPENKDKLIPYSFIPFHAGPRNCIGARFALLEVKTAIASILMKYNLTPCAKTSKQLDFSRVTVLLHAKNVIIHYSPRN